MHAGEFILIPERMFMSKQPLKSEILDNSAYRNKAAQLTLMQKICQVQRTAWEEQME